jgi:hypothetical protein
MCIDINVSFMNRPNALIPSLLPRTQVRHCNPLSQSALSHFTAFLRAFLLLTIIGLVSPAFAQIDSEQLINSTGCAAQGQDATDWDTFAECWIANGPWHRAPLYLGAGNCTSGTAGELEYALGLIEWCNGTIFNSLGATGGSATALSSLAPASVAPSAINNVTYNQTWTWNSLTTQNALTLSSLTASTGTLFTVSTTSTVSGVGPLINVSTTGVGTTTAISASMTGGSGASYAGYFNNTSTSGYGVYSAGTSPNYFAGGVNIAASKNFQFNGTAVLALPDANDTTGIAVGLGALGSQNSNTLNNTAVGYRAAYSATSGADNTAVGYEAAYTNSAISGITAVGYETLYSTTAINDGFGYQAGDNNTSGSDSVAIGYQSILSSVTTPATGGANTAVGFQALYFPGAGTDNTAVGKQALYSNTGSDACTAVGSQALYNLTNTGDSFGYQAGYNITNGLSNVAIGYQSMYGSGSAPLTSITNTAVGAQALYSIQSTATENTAVGYQSLYSMTTGIQNTAMGYQALYSVTTASHSTAIGYLALYSSTTQNDALGYEAGQYITTGTGNVAVGYEAMQGISGTPLTGNYNTAVGHLALNSLQGSAVGNTALGYQAGYAGSYPVTTDTYNTFIGYQAQEGSGGPFTNGTAIGNGAILTASNSIVLGNTSIGHLYSHAAGISPISDRRLKKDITDLPSSLGLDFIEKLKPVSYRLNNGDETERYGFIAQDLEQALPAPLMNTVETAQPEHGVALIQRQNDKTRTYRLSYGELTAPIVKAIQDERQEIVADHAEISHLGKTGDLALHEEIKLLTTRLDAEVCLLYIIPALVSFGGVSFGFRLGRRKRR